jgi:integrase
MFPKTPTGKASKGDVSVSSDRGRLRLSFPRQLFDGKQKFMFLGLADTPENRAIAEAKALQANLDIRNNEFDFSFNKYKPQTHLAVVEVLKPKPAIKLDQLWQQYVEFKKPSVSPNTVRHGYRQTATHIAQLPTKNIEDAVVIRDFLAKESGLSTETIKRICIQINACCNWAVDSGIIKNNPFTKLFKDIKTPKSKRKTELEDIRPFSAEERDAIITALETNQYCHAKTSKNKLHSAYAPFVKFLFFTGCRPSEAIALQWKHILRTDKVTDVIFEQSVIDGEYGRVLREGLKTQEMRRIRVNNQIREILDSVKPENVSPDALVFPSPVNSGWIDFHNFSYRVWKPLLKKMGIEYRKPYNMRHTFITLCREAGTDIKDLARIVGNSPEIILKHYLGNKRDLQIPEL